MSNQMATMQGCCCGGSETCEECFPDGSEGDVEVDMPEIGTFTAASIGDCEWEYDAGEIDCDNPWIGIAYTSAPPLTPGWYVGINDSAPFGFSINAASYRAGPFATCEELFDTLLTMTRVSFPHCTWGDTVDVTLTYIG